jgi:hypothetical protein
MKLYTEQQLTRYLLDEGIMELSDLANNLIPPIELPSDDEIWDRADEILGRAESEQSDVRHLAFMQSAKWIRDKIQGGNK